VLHGWERYAHHHGHVLLSREDYVAALKSALRGERHAPADMRAEPKPAKPAKPAKTKEIDP
jgi:hypothetical protein